jgi:hypothetical protein
MELEGSLPCSKEPASVPYSEPEDLVHILSYYFFLLHFIRMQQLKSTTSKFSLHLGFLTEILYAFLVPPMRGILPAILVRGDIK